MRASAAETRPFTISSSHTLGEFRAPVHLLNVVNHSKLMRFLAVGENRTARNSKPLEVIGTYDPVPKPDPYDESGRLHKDIKIDAIRARYWVGVGAQPSDTVWRLLSMVREKLSVKGEEKRPANVGMNPSPPSSASWNPSIATQNHAQHLRCQTRPYRRRSKRKLLRRNKKTLPPTSL